MKTSSIKALVELHSVDVLQRASEKIESGEEADIEVEGVDEGEKLTHVLAAEWVRQRMDADGLDFRKAMRDYVSKVRNSIS